MSFRAVNGGSQTFLPASNGADDTAAIQAILANGGNIAGKKGETYTVKSALTVKSGTHLDMTGCTVDLVGYNGYLLRNTALGGAGARDSDISVKGGTWTRDGTASSLHLLAFHRIDGVRVEDVTCETSEGKFSILLADVTDWKVLRPHFNAVHSDGVHVQGPASVGLIDSPTGSSGDDLVAIGGRDYTGYELTAGGGNLSEIEVRNVQGDTNTAGSLVHVWAGASVTARGITIDGVKGTSTREGVSVSDDTTDANTTGNDIVATVRNVEATVPAGYAQVAISGANTRTVTVDGVEMTQEANAAYCVQASNGENINIKNMTLRCTASVNHSGFYVPAGKTVSKVKIDGASVNVDSTKANGQLATISGTISKPLQISNSSQDGGRAFVYHNSGVALTVHLTNVDMSGIGAGMYAASAAALTSIVAGLTSTGTTTFQVTNGSGSLVVIGHAINGASMFLSSTQSVRINAPTFSVDVSKLTPSDGDRAYNSNAALGCGSGPVVYNTAAAKWKHLYTGLTTA